MSRIRLAAAAVCLAALPSDGQESTLRTYVLDPNGRRIEWSSVQTGDSTRSETVANLNGARVPLEEVEEKVLEKEGGRVVIEKTVRRRAPDGRLLPAEKTRVETLAGEDGTETQTVIVFRGDLNGALKPAERSTTRSVKSGGQIQSETLVERLSMSGSFAVAERRAATVQAAENKTETNIVVYRPDQNGRMAEAVRQTIRAEVSNGVTTEQTDEYENASTGQMRLSRQTLARTVKNPDGTERKEVDVFGPAAPGRTANPGDRLALRERQIIDRTVSNGQAVERFSIQRPALDDDRKLSKPQLISETVCQGKCK